MRKLSRSAYEDTKGLVRAAETLLEVVVMTLLYYGAFRKGYEIEHFVYKGKYVLMGVYGALLYVMFLNSDCTLFGQLHRLDLIIGQVISLFVVNFLTYFQLCLIANTMIAVGPMLLLLLAEIVVAVDVASVQLFGENNGMPQFSRHVDLCIDHHAGNSGYAEYTLLDGHAAAAAELLYDVICAMGVDLTAHMANCLYTGLSTDTGCFRFSSTTARTHIIAAKLMEAGARVEELNTLLFDTKPRERMEAERIARNHLEYHLDGRCALIYLTRDEIEQSKVDPADLEELTGLPISIEGVKVGLTLRQQPGGSYRISVRTAKGVDACAIARRLGGGGHTRAAGCELLGNLDNTKSAILAEVEAVLDAPQEGA